MVPGGNITWFLQVINAGTDPLSDVTLASSQCGDASFPGTLAPGAATALVSCNSVAQPDGPATNTTDLTATEAATGAPLTSTVTSSVDVLPGSRLATVAYGYPDPGQPGQSVTWFLQGVNDGATDLADISWSSDQCGDQSFTGPFAPGARTPLVSCETVPSVPGTLVNTVQYRATVAATGQLLTSLVSTEADVVAASPSPTSASPSSSPSSPSESASPTSSPASSGPAAVPPSGGTAAPPMTGGPPGRTGLAGLTGPPAPTGPAELPATGPPTGSAPGLVGGALLLMAGTALVLLANVDRRRDDQSTG